MDRQRHRPWPKPPPWSDPQTHAASRSSQLGAYVRICQNWATHRSVPSFMPNMDAQLGSRLLCAPLEIRRAIYAYLVPYGVHASMRGDNVFLSACIQPHPNNSLSGEERTIQRGWAMLCVDPRFSRRLRSSWGPHWECQEIASRDHPNPELLIDYDDLNIDLNVLRVCHRA
jgi:hypothetical protein